MTDKDDLRYDATIVARNIARASFTKKTIVNEREKHYEELVRHPEFIKYMQSLASNNMQQQPLQPSVNINDPLNPISKPEEESVYAQVDYDTEFIPKRMVANYKDHNGLRAEVLGHIIHSPDPLMLIGDKGTGKTACVHDIASDLYEQGKCQALLTMQGNYNTGDKHIIGYNRLKGLSGETVKGFAVNLVCCANHMAEKHGVNNLTIGLADEFANMPIETSLIFASLLDGRRMIQSNDGKVWRLNEGANLAFIATGNPSHYTGVNQLQEALLSRFTGYYISYPDVDSLKEIIDWTNVPDGYRDAVLTLCSDIYMLKQKGDVEYVVSPRDLAQFTSEFRIQDKLCGGAVALEYALEKTVLFKFQDMTERELIRKSINDTFAIDLKMRFS